MKPLLLRSLVRFALLSTFATKATTLFAQGNLAPAGAPAPGMRTLTQVEPRTPIGSLPFTITTPGSYYVTTNLTGTSGTNGITITVSDVRVDLSGFVLTGIGSSLSGVQVPNTGLTNISVRNGTVRGWPMHGLEVNSDYAVTVEHIDASENGRSGIFCLSGGAANFVVRHCNATRNNTANAGGSGIVTSGGTIVDCTAMANLNSAPGISAGSGALVSHCLVRNNSGPGISANGASVLDCESFSNTGVGIYAGADSLVARCSSVGNTSDGIVLLRQCQATDNHSVDNGFFGTGAGIRASSFGNRIAGNIVSGNTTGVLVDAGATNNVVIQNTAGRNPPSGAVGSANFVFNAFTIFGPTNNAFNPATGAITNLNPWANINH